MAEDRAAAAADRAATEATLSAREARIVGDSDSIRRSLDEYRQRVEARERALDARETEMTRREEVAAQADLDLSCNREELESRERDLAQTLASHEAEVAHHQAHVRWADERLAKRKTDQDAEHQARLHAVRTQVSREYSSKFKKQEERFQTRSGEDARRIQQLEHLNVTLRAANSRYKTARDCTVADRAKVQADLDSLTANMHDLS